jgi:hypothetical protein
MITQALEASWESAAFHHRAAPTAASGLRLTGQEAPLRRFADGIPLRQPLQALQQFVRIEAELPIIDENDFV